MSESEKAGIEFYGGYQVYSESGVDLTLLRENLKRSVDERLARNERMLRFFTLFPSGNAHQGEENRGERRSHGVMEMESFLRQLAESHVSFIVIGGIAMRMHGSAHVTDDFDICYGRAPDNVKALAVALAPLHPYMRGAPKGLPFKFDPPTIQAGLNFTLTTDAGDLDVLGEVSGVGNYDKCLAQSEEKQIGNWTVQVLSLDGLIAAKRAAGRAKDRNHLLELEELKKLRDSAP